MTSHESGERLHPVPAVDVDPTLVGNARFALIAVIGLRSAQWLLMTQSGHRADSVDVANSLQIIASVLLQGARKVQSDETRHYLNDAHHRVMSIATLQKQLAASTSSSVELETYFVAICESIGAAMIHDHARLSLKVDTDHSVIDADSSTSLGLIITELVINSLKHAFPGNRVGRITVCYRAHGPDWALLVSDDGIGMPTASGSIATGLGTGIVHALAQQLQARVEVTDENPGTTVAIVRSSEASLVNTSIRRSKTLAVWEKPINA